MVKNAISTNYTYVGDRYAKTGTYTGQKCDAVRRANGKCIRGKNGNMLVDFSGKRVVVPAKHLRKIEALKDSDAPVAVVPVARVDAAELRIFAPTPEVDAITREGARIVDVLGAHYDSIIGGILGKSANTRRTYARNAAPFIRYIENNGMSGDALARYREALTCEIGISVRTKNARIAAAAALLREAHRLGVLPLDITQGVPMFKAPRGHVKDGLSGDEVRRVFAAIGEKKNRGTRLKLTAMFYLMVAEGLRQFEVQNLTGADVDIAGRCIRFRGKGKDAKERFFITPQTADALAAHITDAGTVDGYLFTSDKNQDEPVSLRAIRKYFTEPKYGIFARAGIQGKSTHGFRHYSITTTLAATGGDLAKTRRRSRHAGFDMLTVYDDERLARADVDALAKSFVF